MLNKSDPRIDGWWSISDFTPGCYNYSNISNSKAVVPARPGAADARYTSGCMALDTGGLGPMPKFTTGYKYPVGNPTFTNKVYIVGLATIPLTGRDGIVSIAESWKATKHLLQVVELYATGTTHYTLLTHVVTATTANSFFGAPFPAMTRMAASTPTTKAGHPVLVFPTSVSGIGIATGQLWQYPNITLDTTNAPKNLLTTGDITGQVVVHNGRVLVFVGIKYNMGHTGINVNENIGYTGSNAQTYTTGRVVLSPQFPYGYGCAGSISAGELFLVKKRGGAIMMNGDILSPSVTNYPGVQSTGDFYGQCAQTPAGILYCATGLGAWVWNGGNLASKISQNLTDDFFVCTKVVPNCNNLGFYVQAWGEWVLFSNSWLFNLRQRSWWKLPVSTLFHYQPGRTTRYMYASPQVVTNATSYYLYKIDKNTPVTSYTWQSLPNRLEQNRFIDIREVVIYASNPATTTSHIKISIYNAATTTFTYTTAPATNKITKDPTMIRIATGGINLYNAIIKITATGNGSGAPILHGLTLGYRTVHHAGATR